MANASWPRPSPGCVACSKGRVSICGKDVTNRSPGEIIDAGFSLIPEDRMGVGLIPTLSVEANAILKSYRLPPIARGPLIDLAEARRYAERLVKEFSVQVARMGDPVGKLSGGNLQRLLLAREMLARPRVMIAVHPTRGLDVQATADVHRLLLQQRAEGGAILLISEDLDEILALSDCVAVIHEGQIMGRFARGEVDIAEIGLLMAGHAHEGGARMRLLIQKTGRCAALAVSGGAAVVGALAFLFGALVIAATGGDPVQGLPPHVPELPFSRATAFPRPSSKRSH